MACLHIDIIHLEALGDHVITLAP
uniref:Uncharacterized protein n=1 Tax=Moniliophthora roreri TaxID=221103 RepID=A0A0W0FS33_MONRR